MSQPTHREPAQATQSASEDDQAAGLTRRTVLAAAAATTAAVTIGIDTPVIAQTAAQLEADVNTFVTLSAALTGVARAKLFPFADPLDVKTQYFNQASGKADDEKKIPRDDKRAADFAVLLKIARDANLQVPPSAPGLIKQEDVDKLVKQIQQAGDDVKYLARSIVLMWYLGSWYEPAKLKELATSTKRHSIRKARSRFAGRIHERPGMAGRPGPPDGLQRHAVRLLDAPAAAESRFHRSQNREGRGLIMADEEVDVVIVGSGFAGALIANDLAKQGKKVVILEAGDGIPPNINEYMERFYQAENKVPESPYTPSISDKRGHCGRRKSEGRARRPADGHDVGARRLEKGRQELFCPDRAYAVQQHLRPCRRRHVALARHHA